MAKRSASKVEEKADFGEKRVLEKLVQEGENLNPSDIGLMWRKPFGLFNQVADDLRKGCVYKCVDVSGEAAVLKIATTSLIYRCYDHFIFKSPFYKYDDNIFVNYYFIEEKENFTKNYGVDSRDITLINEFYFIKFDVVVGIMGLYLKGITLMVKYNGTSIY